ncbi:ATP-binding protein [Clostridium sp.]
MGIAEPCLYSCNSIITDVNNEFIDFIGFTRDELIGKSLIEIGAIIRINTQILLENITSEYSGYVFTKSLSAREVNISHFHDKDTNDKIYSFVEKPNSRIDDKMIFMEQTLSDNIVGISIYTVPDLIMVKVNQKYLDFHDSPYNEQQTSIGLSIREIVTKYVGTESEVITNTVIESRKSGYLKEIKFERFDRGITYWDSNRTPIFENGIMKFIMFTTSESTENVLKNQSIERQNKIIEEQKKQKEDLKEKNIQLRSILSNLDEGVMVTDSKGKYIMMNSEAKRLVYQSSEVMDLGDTAKNTRYFDMKNNEMAYDNLPGIRALRGVITKDIKLHVVNPQKDYFMNNSASPIYNTNGDLTMVVTCFHDITKTIKQSRKIEEQKAELEKTLKLQEEFIVNTSHELKTPLNVIFSAVQLFSMYCSCESLDEKKSSIIKYIESIRQNSYRLSKLINNIVDSSKIEAGFFKINLSNNNIVEVVEEIVMSVTNLTESKGLNIIFDTDIEEKIVACDPEKIERIVLNLISNAIKFSNYGDEIFVQVKDRNEFVEISVKDNGIGIEEKYLDMIFDRFKQVDKSLSRNSEGTGIGLSLVKSIVELHGGSIRVESKYGKGSKFTVMIPSRKVMTESSIHNNEVKSGDQNIRVELSDVYS